MKIRNSTTINKTRRARRILLALAAINIIGGSISHIAAQSFAYNVYSDKSNEELTYDNILIEDTLPRQVTYERESMRGIHVMNDVYVWGDRALSLVANGREGNTIDRVMRANEGSTITVIARGEGVNVFHNYVRSSAGSIKITGDKDNLFDKTVVAEKGTISISAADRNEFGNNRNDGDSALDAQVSDSIIDVKAQHNIMNGDVQAFNGGQIQVVANSTGNNTVNGRLLGIDGGNVYIASYDGGNSIDGSIVARKGQITIDANNGTNSIGSQSSKETVILDAQTADSVINVNGTNNIVNASIQAYYMGNINIEAQTGGQNIINGSSLSARGGVVAIRGETKIENPSAMKSDGFSDTGNPSLLNLEYAGSSTVIGDVQAMNGGKIFIVPQANLDATTMYLKGTVDDGVLSFAGLGTKGDITFTLTPQSVWEMTGQSSVTTLNGIGGQVYLHELAGVADSQGRALHIGALAGNHSFVMQLSKSDPSKSDMLYIQNGTADEQTIIIRNFNTLAKEMKAGDFIRFATVKNSQNEFRDGKVIAIVPRGLRKNNLVIQYRDVTTDSLNTSKYNDAYNTPSNGFINKPGTVAVSTLYSNGENAKNVYITLMETVNLSDFAKAAIPNANVIRQLGTDLDTYTRRKGNTQYFDSHLEDGQFVRMSYQRRDFDSVSKMAGNGYEFGYAKLQEHTDEKSHKQSIAVSYRKNKGSFTNELNGDLAVRDGALTAYDTSEYRPSMAKKALMQPWERDQYTYRDSYLRLHYLRTAYTVFDSYMGERVDANYHRFIGNFSTEWGRQKPVSESWALMPQIQVQVSYLGSTSYRDTQKLHTDISHSWSAVGRLGIEGVKKLNTEGTRKFHMKTSVYHEFLNGGRLTTHSYATDGLTDDYYSTALLGKGTWYSVGLGYSWKRNAQQYFFVDGERVWGGQYKAYNVQAGIQWKY